jgi:release factor glutamine methyltransferase
MRTTIQAALRQAAQAVAPTSDSAAQDVALLLAEILGVERAYLHTHPEQWLTEPQRERFEAWVERCVNGEPLAYVLGRRSFFDRMFTITPDVLIPRPETELLLEAALQYARLHPELTAVDVGTGSGALAVTLAARVRTVTVYATDVSPAALAVAEGNARRHQAPVTFWEGDLLMPLLERGITVDLLMANLPYIPTDVVVTLPVSRYEPLLALDGGPDGLELIRRLLEQAQGVMRTGGLILLEIGYDQGMAAQWLAEQVFPQAQVRVDQDFADLDRIVRIQI